MAPIRDIITSLLHDGDGDQPDIPDGALDLSDAIPPLRRLTFNGRALRSADEFSMAQMLGNLLDAYLPENHSDRDKDRCVFGLTVLIAHILRYIPDLRPDMSLEEFLLDAVHQDVVADLCEEFKTSPIKAHASISGANIAEHFIFAMPIPLTDQAIDGFIERQIRPHDDNEDNDYVNEIDLLESDGLLLTLIDALPKGVDLTIQPASSHDGFDDFYNAYFDREFNKWFGTN